MNVHQTQYLERISFFIPEEKREEVITEIKASFDESDDLRQHTFVTLAKLGHYDAAANAKNEPLYDITFSDPYEGKMLSERHDPDRYKDVGSTGWQEIVEDDANEIVEGYYEDTGIGHYEYGGCPGYHSQVDFEYQVHETEVEWSENFDELMTDKELTEYLQETVDDCVTVTVGSNEKVTLSICDVKACSITPVTLNYRGEVDGEWKTTATRKMYRYDFSGTVGEGP